LEELSKQSSEYINASNPNQISKPLTIPKPKPKIEKRKKKNNLKIRAKDLENETIENSISSQMGGQMATLRLYLRQLDGSNSGHVNFEEFNTALIKAGINTPKSSLKDFFYKNAHLPKEINSLDLGINRLEVNIEELVSRLQNRTSTPGFDYLATAESKQAKSAEERRIMKKILNVTCRNANVYSNIFDHLDNSQSHRGWVEPLQMKEGLQKLGVNLSNDEYNSLLNRVDLNHNGKISIKGFDGMLNEEINKSHYNSNQLKNDFLKNYSRYNQSFKSSDLIQQNSNPDCGEYENFGNSDVIKRNKLMWSKLKGCLQNQRDIVQKAFSKGCNTYLNNGSRDENILDLGKLDKEEELSISQLQSRFASLGLPLSNEDIDHLDYHIQEKKFETSNFKDTKDTKVSLNSFCDVVGIPVTKNVKNEKQLDDPRLVYSDGGIYASSALSQHGNATYSSTIFKEGNEEKSIWIKGNTKRKVPLSEFATEPSKFWTLDRGDESPEFYFGQSPLPSFRDCGQQMNHIRGLPTSPTSRQSRRVKSSIEIDDSINIGEKKEFYKFPSELDNVTGFKSLKGDNVSRTRSSSAPCRTQRIMRTRSLGDFMEVKSRLGLEMGKNDENSNSLTNFITSDKWKGI
jgi:Ca2+-binding EF-hand superfamily protein